MASLDIGSGYVPDFIRNEVLPNLPRQSGEGIHRALYDLARVLTPYRTVAEREAILRRYASPCERHVPENEITDALRCGALRAWRPNGYTSCGGEGSKAMRGAQGGSTLRRSGRLSQVRHVLTPNGSERGVRFPSKG
jgi:hypothetical protein